MSEAKTYQCRCGNHFAGKSSMIPHGWEWFGSLLLCDDCAPKNRESIERATTYAMKQVERTGGNDNKPSSIRLRSGAYLDLKDPDCSVITPIDIASGLRNARFCAQPKEFYTIAQHCVLVLSLVEPVAKEIGGPKGDALRRCALMHDAAEAFIHDITKPLKDQLPDYQKIEAMLERRIEKAFGVVFSKDRRAIVKRADVQALAFEKRALWQPFLPDQCPQIKRIWTIDEAEDRFLETFTRLFPEFERIAA